MLAARGGSLPTSTTQRRDLLAQKFDEAEALLDECDRQVSTRRVLAALYRYLAGQDQDV